MEVPDKKCDNSEPNVESAESEAAMCSLCARFAESIRDEAKEQAVGTFGALLNNNGCETCQKLAYAIEEKLGAENIQDNKAQMRLLTFQNQTFRLFIGHHYSDFPLLPVSSNASEGIFGATIDQKSVRRLIEECDRSHVGICHSLQSHSERTQPAVELLMIDVERHCLTPMSGSFKYIALSYVWGQSTAAPVQTVAKNFHSLCVEDAFQALIDKSLLLATIEDSMLLTRDMGVKYLWVDRFCIIQDDPIQKPAQLQAMASIYANAYFTIAACEGPNGDFGLPGWPQHRPRTNPFFTFDFSPFCRMVSCEPIKSRGGYRRYRYHTRAWTFQEWNISSRLLAFHHQTVSWICKKIHRQENGSSTSIRCLPPWQYVGQSVMQKMPDIGLYMDNINLYSIRFLTYQDDGLSAFSAIITCTEQSMKGGILFGIPEMIFDGALLWKTGDEGRPTRRRNVRGECIKKLPSWSCFGWTQRINMRFWQMVYSYKEEKDGTCRKVPDKDLLTLRPITRWYKIGALTGTRIAIHNTFYVKDQTTGSLMDIRYDQLGTTFKFADPALPVSEYSNEPWEPVIECRTRRHFLKMRLIEPDAPLNPFNNEVDNVLLEDRYGNVIGRLDNVLRGVARSTAEEPTLCELIAISATEGKWRGVKPSVWKEAEYLHLKCPATCRKGGDMSACTLGAEWKYKFYFVLWVEWEDGIAYRKALGRVFQEYWDNADTEEIDVRLG